MQTLKRTHVQDSRYVNELLSSCSMLSKNQCFLKGIIKYRDKYQNKV